MAQDRANILRLIETAENFAEYAAPRKEARAETMSATPIKRAEPT